MPKEGNEKEKKAGPGNWETGYRGWVLRFRNREPRLGALTREAVWEPEEVKAPDAMSRDTRVVRSDWKGEKEEGPFAQTSKGLYFLKSLKDVRSHYKDQADIYGAVIPFGTYEEGSMGFRAHEAKVRSIFRGAVPCYVCRKPSTRIIHNGEKFAICEAHYGLILKKLEKSKDFTAEETDELLRKLAEAYDAELAEMPMESESSEEEEE